MTTLAAPPTITDLQRRLSELQVRDGRRLGRRLESVRRTKDQDRRRGILTEIDADVQRAEARLAARRAGVPTIAYPEQLPVSQRKDEILAAIRDHQVVIVAGETGSGKTTQLPKICLELGRGVRGLIGHTQPRRLAARAVADRISEELGTELGQSVGYTVRFADTSSDDTLVKVMTDGILLAEMQNDRLLERYDTLIIDEAHERSLNIDFLLGYIARLLPARPDLKVVITSATIDPQRFSEHFSGAPIIEVSGRTYPVEVRYRPVVDPDDPQADPDRDQVQAILDAVEELALQGPGDVLVFLSGEREIRDTAEALQRAQPAASAQQRYEIVPLYARLSAAEQHRVFAAHTGRRVVLATNVAETSLTVPGIRYVVDPGTARVSRYSQRLKVQRLPIERVSQASADQRKGRCGRTSDGICIRLYTEDDFDSRPRFTDPEILRTNLASVILQMAALALGDVADFPFMDPPDRRNVKDGVELLEELGALEQQTHGLTELGRRLASLPVDPRLGRMVLEGDRNGCVREVMVIAAALSIQDPREQPAEKKEAARQQHARFVNKESDFLSYLLLWDYLKDRQTELSSNGFRRLCRAEFLNYLRVREWQDVYSQLRQVAKTLGVTLNSAPGDPQKIHVSLLSGLLSHIGLKDVEKQDYVGARAARFAVFPGSGLYRKQPRWVMAAELVETARLYARVVAQIEPEWVEPLAEHLVRRTYSEPHWEAKRGSVMGFERVTLYGVPIVAQRPVMYGRIDPALSRELFIRHALVQGEWTTHHPFFAANRALLEDAEELEHRSRRRGLVVDDDALFAFYDQRVGAEAISARHFDTWWKQARRTQPDLLTFTPEMLVTDRAGDVHEEDYPDQWVSGDLSLPLTYQFEPGTDADGVTVHIPLTVLGRLDPREFEWHVAGVRDELVTALIRSLPKSIRRSYVPAPNFATAVLQRLGVRHGSLLAAVAAELSDMGGSSVHPDDFELDRLPDHLRMTFRVQEDRVQEDRVQEGRVPEGRVPEGERDGAAAGRTLAEGKDLAALQQQLRPALRRAIAQSAGSIERTGLSDWTLGALQRSLVVQRGEHAVHAYPALVDERTSVAVRLMDTAEDQLDASWRGERRLLLLTTPAPVKAVAGSLSNASKLALSSGIGQLGTHGSVAELFQDCTSASVDALMRSGGAPVWDEAAFRALREHVRAGLYETLEQTVRGVEPVLRAASEVQGELRATTSLALLPALSDLRAQLAALLRPGFVTEIGVQRLPDLQRYLRAMARRLEKLPHQVARDHHLQSSVEQLQEEYDKLLAALPPGRPVPAEVRELRWVLEELRVSYFAQTLRAAYPVSDKRFLKSVDEAWAAYVR